MNIMRIIIDVMRLIISIILCLISLFCFLGAIFSLCGIGIQSTIENNHYIDASFRKAVAFIEAKKKEKGRLPTSSEFKQWATKYPGGPYRPANIDFIVSDFPSEAIEEFGSCPIPGSFSYLLACWHGEWFDYYASWVQKSNLSFDLKSYYLRGTPFAIFVFLIIVCVIILFLAVKLWPNKELETNP